MLMSPPKSQQGLYNLGHLLELFGLYPKARIARGRRWPFGVTAAYALLSLGVGVLRALYFFVK
jgi:hypothetical protein